MSEHDDDWVRRALSSTRPDGPLPDDVAARLDDRLDELHQERYPSEGVPLTRRRRRAGPYVLAAAAVAAVVAIGVPVVRHLGTSPVAGDSSASSAGGSASAPSSTPGLVTPDSSAGSQARQGFTAEGPQLHADTFAADVAAALPQLVQAAEAYALGGSESAGSCAATPAAGTRGGLALLDGRPVLVEIAPPSQGARTVRALSCSDAAVVASASVPTS